MPDSTNEKAEAVLLKPQNSVSAVKQVLSFFRFSQEVAMVFFILMGIAVRLARELGADPRFFIACTSA